MATLQVLPVGVRLWGGESYSGDHDLVSGLQKGQGDAGSFLDDGSQGTGAR